MGDATHVIHFVSVAIPSLYEFYNALEQHGSNFRHVPQPRGQRRWRKLYRTKLSKSALHVETRTMTHHALSIAFIRSIKLNALPSFDYPANNTRFCLSLSIRNNIGAVLQKIDKMINIYFNTSKESCRFARPTFQIYKRPKARTRLRDDQRVRSSSFFF